MKKKSEISIWKFIFSILFNSTVLLVALFVFRPFFEEIDDTQVCMLAEGAFGVKEWHLIYPNFILGKLYVLLQNVFPHVRWHVVLQYGFIYIAYVFSVYVISKHRRGIPVAIVAVMASFYELYVSLQYTKTASFVCVAGYILIFEAVRNKAESHENNRTVVNYDSKENKKETVMLLFVAFILIVYGALLRPESFFIAAVPAVAVGFLELARTKALKKYIFILVPVFIVVLLLKYADSFVYSMDSSWSDFMKYNRARMELNDYRYDILDFSRYSDELNALNVSENDALAILTYQYGDDEILSYERFKEIRDAFSSREFGYVTFANLFENLVNEVAKSYTMVIGMIGLTCILIASIIIDRSKSSPGYIKDSRRKLLSVAGIVFFCAAAVVYFQYSGRYSHRLIGAITIPTMFLVCYMIDSIFIKENDSKIIFGGNRNDITVPMCIIVSIVLIGALSILFKSNINNYRQQMETNVPVLRELDEISRDKNNLYVADTFTFQDVWKYEVFRPFDQGELGNFVTFGSWYVNSPVTKSVTGKFDYNNPYDALRRNRGNVYLLDNLDVECKLLFLNEHYDNVYDAKKVDERGGISVYQVFVNDVVQEIE